MTLSSRIEAGTAEQQRELLEEAFRFLATPKDERGLRPLREFRAGLVFSQLLAIGTDEAFTGAALMLVPEETFWSITMRGVKRGGFHAVCAPRAAAVSFHACGCTPALAIAAACVKAKEIERG